MKTRPILFSAPMVRALLDGSKTQTRRVVKPQPYIDQMGNACWNGHNFGQSAQGVPHIKQLASPFPSSKTKRVHCPYGIPGDRLWVRETWAAPHSEDGRPPRAIQCDQMRIHYSASEDRGGLLWRPSIHMPRWASRITLEITGVRVERLQDISEADAIAEGIERIGDRFKGYLPLSTGEHYDPALAKSSYSQLWQLINGPGSWAANPWVWAIEFKVL